MRCIFFFSGCTHTSYTSYFPTCVEALSVELVSFQLVLRGKETSVRVAGEGNEQDMEEFQYHSTSCSPRVLRFPRDMRASIQVMKEPRVLQEFWILVSLCSWCMQTWFANNCICKSCLHTPPSHRLWFLFRHRSTECSECRRTIEPSQYLQIPRLKIYSGVEKKNVLDRGPSLDDSNNYFYSIFHLS